MQFEWDPVKEETNLRKHGITFAFAAAVFLDPDHIEELDTRVFDEERWIVIGRTREFLLVVVYTLRGENIRIISARRGDRDDYRKYRVGQV